MKTDFIEDIVFGGVLMGRILLRSQEVELFVPANHLADRSSVHIPPTLDLQYQTNDIASINDALQAAQIPLRNIKIPKATAPAADEAARPA